jgi:hypothetical protein
MSTLEDVLDRTISWPFATLKDAALRALIVQERRVNEYTAVNNMQKPNSLLIGFRLALKGEGREHLGGSESLLSSAARPSTKEQFPTRTNKMVKDYRHQCTEPCRWIPHTSNEEGML